MHPYPSTSQSSFRSEGDSHIVVLVDTHDHHGPVHADRVKAVIHARESPNAVASFTAARPAYCTAPPNSPADIGHINEISTSNSAAKAFGVYSKLTGCYEQEPLATKPANITRSTSLESFSYSSWDGHSEVEFITQTPFPTDGTLPFPIYCPPDITILSPMTLHVPTPLPLPRRLNLVSPNIIKHALCSPVPRSRVFSPGARTPPLSLTKSVLEIMTPTTPIRKQKFVAEGFSSLSCDIERPLCVLSLSPASLPQDRVPKPNSGLFHLRKNATEAKDFRISGPNTPPLPTTLDFPSLSTVPSLSSFASPFFVRKAIRNDSPPGRLHLDSTDISTIPPSQLAPCATVAQLASPTTCRSGHPSFIHRPIDFSAEFLHESPNILSPIADHSHEFGRDSFILPYNSQSRPEDAEMLTAIKLDISESPSSLFDSPKSSRNTRPFCQPSSHHHLFKFPRPPFNSPGTNPSSLDSPRSRLGPSSIFNSDDDSKLRALDNLITTFSEDMQRLEELRVRIGETQTKIRNLLALQHGNILNVQEPRSETDRGEGVDNVKCRQTCFSMAQAPTLTFPTRGNPPPCYTHPPSAQAQPKSRRRSSMIPVNISRSQPFISRLSSFITTPTRPSACLSTRSEPHDNKPFTNVTHAPKSPTVVPTGIANKGPIPYIRRQFRKPVGVFGGRFGFGLVGKTSRRARVDKS